MWDLPGPGIKPVSPGLAGGSLTIGPPERPHVVLKTSSGDKGIKRMSGTRAEGYLQMCLNPYQGPCPRVSMVWSHWVHLLMIFPRKGDICFFELFDHTLLHVGS